MTRIPPGSLLTLSGSTVHHGVLQCECFECWHERRQGRAGHPAAWSCWRINGRRVDTWIVCNEHLAESKRVHDEPVPHLYLPLLQPSDAYARIAVEEMLYALAALGETVRHRQIARIARERDEAYRARGGGWR